VLAVAGMVDGDGGRCGVRKVAGYGRRLCRGRPLAMADCGRGWTPPALVIVGCGGLESMEPGACCVRATAAKVRWLVLPFSSSTMMLGRRCLGGGESAC
jgi:hypothetical protein